MIVLLSAKLKDWVSPRTASVKEIVGAHVGRSRPLDAAAALGADCVQIFLSDPQGWKKPPPRADAGDLRASGVPVYFLWRRR